ncbi:basic helix-loop-helix DNA-binding superfamily protein [Prunus dulcis]|uniref:Basic helix-loop-helix DNA-binding superfamily protein n=1 Tax=Prunus dulcis TaxID=3755 RepID=A0A4Y1QPP5_PRUDU|nr:basic helix-loop-helix DNA-binding superfamily protein [Prunus dulcis]
MWLLQKTQVEKKRKKMVSEEEGERKGKKQRKQNGSEAKKQSKVAAAFAEGVQRNGVRVKARRGEATDSHSLAERINGKAHVLDEIIKYVQLLQNQVECLAAELAFVDAMLYDDSELNPSTNPCASDQRLCCLEPPSSVQFRSLADAAPPCTFASLLLTEDQKASLIPQVQDGGSFEDIGKQPAGLDHSWTF